MKHLIRAWNWLKEKWNIDSDRRMAVIFVVFAITGSLAAFSRKWIFAQLGIEPFEPMILDFAFRILFIYVMYQVVLFILGHVFGEGAFFRWFLAKMNKRLIPGQKKKK
jgi:hypothetical protein